jgi:hypothetical protein
MAPLCTMKVPLVAALWRAGGALRARPLSRSSRDVTVSCVAAWS